MAARWSGREQGWQFAGEMAGQTGADGERNNHDDQKEPVGLAG